MGGGEALVAGPLKKNLFCGFPKEMTAKNLFLTKFKINIISSHSQVDFSPFKRAVKSFNELEQEFEWEREQK